MNGWLVIAVAVLAVTSAGGVVGLLLLTKSIGCLVPEVIRNGWQPNHVIRLLRQTALSSAVAAARMRLLGLMLGEEEKEFLGLRVRLNIP